MRTSIYALVICVALLAAGAGCTKERTAAKDPVPVRAEEARAEASAPEMRFSASLAPREQVGVAFKVGGYVEDIAVSKDADGRERVLQKGDPVAKGAYLARIKEADYKAKQAKAKSALDEARASSVQARKDFERAETLARDGYLARSEFDKAKEKLDVCRAREDQAAAQLEEAALAVTDTVVRSPLASVVVARAIEKGSLAAPGTLAFTLADLSSVKAVFGVPDSLLASIKVGDRLAVAIESLGLDRAGTVTAVSPSADPKSRVFDVEITVPNPGQELKDGMVATVRLGAGPAQAAAGQPVVPLTSVVRPPGASEGYMVYVLSANDGKAVASARRISLGRITGNKVAVASGLAPGERVITAGATLVADGQPVALVP